MPLARRPYGWPPGYSAAISASVATTAGLSSSWRIEVTTDDRRSSTWACGKVGVVTTPATRASTSSTSSARHVQLNVIRCRDTPTESDTPRPSNASANASVECACVPRSMTLATKFAVPSAVVGVVPGTGGDAGMNRDRAVRRRVLAR